VNTTRVARRGTRSSHEKKKKLSGRGVGDVAKDAVAKNLSKKKTTMGKEIRMHNGRNIQLDKYPYTEGTDRDDRVPVTS